MMVPKIVLKYGKAIPGDLSRYIEGRDDLYDAYDIKWTGDICMMRNK